jgi:hypothetical protein
MPLSAPAPREHLHTRRYDFRGYHRQDGLWDIEGNMTDVKTYGFDNDWRGEIKPGDPIHDMWLRLTIDDDLLIRDIEVATAASPFEMCGSITSKYSSLKGQRIGPGWSKRVKDAFGGPSGCTHQTEMLVAIATVAYQTVFTARKKWSDEDTGTKRPAFINTCHALASGSPVVKRYWPGAYTGE